MVFSVSARQRCHNRLFFVLRTPWMWIEFMPLLLILALIWTLGACSGAPAGIAPTPIPADDERAEDPRWVEWGTMGSRLRTGKSAQGHARCDLSDIRTDDLVDRSQDQVPRGTWPDVVEDSPSRCGDDLETAAFRLGNCERLSRNLEPFACDLRLVWLGRQHATDMVKRDYFEHRSPDGVSPFDRMQARGLQLRRAAENIAHTPNVELAHLHWMDSEGHRANILGDFTHVGVGNARFDADHHLWVAKFLTPRSGD